MKKYLGSLALIGALSCASAQAMEVNLLGDIGLMYNQGLNNGSKIIHGGKIDKHALLDVSGRFGVELVFGNFSMGIGAIGAFPIYDAPSGWAATKSGAIRDYGDISDLFLKYDSQAFQFAVGRYDAEMFGMDWLSGLVQGTSAKVNFGQMASVWFTWINSQLLNGFQPNRLGSNLTQLAGYYNNFTGTKNMSGNAFMGGVDLTFGFFELNPMINYVMGAQFNGDKGSWYNDILQAGGKIGLNFGKRQSFASNTSVRGMFQSIGINNPNSAESGMIWIDQEFLIADCFRLSGGIISVIGDSGFYSFNDRTRYYGPTYNGLFNGGFGQRPYFAKLKNGATFNWYVGTGLEFDRFKFDFLYGDGDYKEISAILEGSIIKTRLLSFDLGGGYVQSSPNWNYWHSGNSDSVVAYTKVSF